MVLIGSVSAGVLVMSQPTRWSCVLADALVLCWLTCQSFVGDMLVAALTDTSANALMGSDSLPYLRNLSFPNRN